MTSEDALYVVDQPEGVCPLIDDLIGDLEGSPEIDDPSQLIDKIEAIRAEIEKVRAWGQDWKEHAQSYAFKLQSIESIAHSAMPADFSRNAKIKTWEKITV